MDPILWPDVAGFNLTGHLLLVARRGSESHNTYIKPTDPDSVDDRDIYAVAAPPKNYYLGLRSWEHAESIKTAPDGTVWDVCIDELKKFCGLLSKCNPNVVSAVWCRPEDRLYVSPLIEPVLEKRQLFLTKEYAFNAFGGYARGQAKKMLAKDEYNGVMGAKRKKLVDKYGYDCKNAAHCLRLMNMGIELLRDGVVNVWRTHDRQLYIDVKTGKWPLDQVRETFDQLENDLLAARAVSELPDELDFDAVDKLVTAVVGSTL